MQQRAQPSADEGASIALVPRRIGLVGCVKEKAGTARPARDLYVSTLFVGRRAYVERKTVGLQARVSLLERDRLPAAHHHRQLHPGRIPELVETAQRGEGRRFFERCRSVRLEVRPGEGLAAQRTQRDIDLAYVGGERDPVEARPEVDLAQGGRRGEDHRVLPHRMHACQAPAFVQLRL